MQQRATHGGPALTLEIATHSHAHTRGHKRGRRGSRRARPPVRTTLRALRANGHAPRSGAWGSRDSQSLTSRCDRHPQSPPEGHLPLWHFLAAPAAPTAASKTQMRTSRTRAWHVNARAQPDGCMLEATRVRTLSAHLFTRERRASSRRRRSSRRGRSPVGWGLSTPGSRTQPHRRL